MPPSAQVGAVAKSDKALLLISAAHHRDNASPVFIPQRFPPIEHSLSSASNSAEHRIEFPKLTQTSMSWRQYSYTPGGLHRPCHPSPDFRPDQALRTE
jgi:hypothetical protein